MARPVSETTIRRDRQRAWNLAEQLMEVHESAKKDEERRRERELAKR